MRALQEGTDHTHPSRQGQRPSPRLLFSAGSVLLAQSSPQSARPPLPWLERSPASPNFRRMGLVLFLPWYR